MKLWIRLLAGFGAVVLFVVVLIGLRALVPAFSRAPGLGGSPASEYVALWRAPSSPLLFGGARPAAAMYQLPPPSPADHVASTDPMAPLEAMLAARKLIYKGNLALEVASYSKGAGEVGAVARRLGGYVADSQSSQDANGPRRGGLTVRVAAARFDEAMAALKALGEVRREGVSTEDVTKAYTDLEIRLRLKRETEARLRGLLRTQTGKLADVLDVERELARVIEEIERMEGEQRFYDQQLALSTITVELFEKGAFIRPGFISTVGEAIRKAGEVLATSVAFLIYIVVFLAPWLIITAVCWWLVKRIRARRRSVPQQEPPKEA